MPILSRITFVQKTSIEQTWSFILLTVISNKQLLLRDQLYVLLHSKQEHPTLFTQYLDVFSVTSNIDGS